MATTTVSSKGQVVIPRALREKYGLTSGTRLEVAESDDGLVLAPLKQARSSGRQAGWRTLRGSATGTAAPETSNRRLTTINLTRRLTSVSVSAAMPVRSTNSVS